MSISGCIRKFLFGISYAETTFARRGFRPADPRARERLEGIGRIFVDGYHAGLKEDTPSALAARLMAPDREVQGFAFEGAAMALALRDTLSPWGKGRLRAFLDGPGAKHVYMLHVGAGWALARLRRSAEKALETMDPVLRWLAVDGYGFHEGYFHSDRFVWKQAEPAQLHGYARRAFDQGLGRSLWFVTGADVENIATTVASFPQPRQGDLWSGVGLAAGYAGGASEPALRGLCSLAGPFLPQVAQGAAFAAKARLRAANLAPHTELACAIFCRVSAEQAAAITDLALQGLPADDAEPAYEVWRRRIRDHFQKESVRS